MEFIKLSRNELKNALDLVWTVFQEFDVPEDSEQDADEFRKFLFYKSNIDKYDSGELNLWGCRENKELIAVIALKELNHINMLFVKKEYQRQGIAKHLVQMVKEHCQHNKNIDRITVNSSPYALEFYNRLGFIDTDQEQNVNGTIFTPMEYLLK